MPSQIYSKFQEALNKSTEISDRTYILPNELSKKESIDTAIIERSDNIFMSIANVKWYDVGYLYSAWEVAEKDKYGNFSSDNTFLIDMLSWIKNILWLLDQMT